MNIIKDSKSGDALFCYVSPRAEVLECVAGDILCTSDPTGIEPYNLENWL